MNPTQNYSLYNLIPLFLFLFIQMFRIKQMGLALNLHLKTSCIISRHYSNLVELCKDTANIKPITCEDDRPGRHQFIEVNKIIRHLGMFTTHGNRKITYTMDGIIDRTPDEVKFKNRDGITVSMLEYFASEYNMNLQRLPLNKTTGKQACYIPMELCSLFSPTNF